MNEKRKFLTINESGQLYLVTMIALFVLQLIVLLVPSKQAAVGGISISSWVILALNPAVIAASCFLFARSRKIDLPKTAGFRGKLSAKQVLVLFFLAIFAIMAFLPLSQLFVKLLKLMGFSKASGFPQAENVGVFFLEVFVVAMLPAFAEELFMRGGILTGLKNRSYMFAIVISALLFSLMHASALQTVHQFGFGIVLAVVFMVSGSFWAPVLLHFFNNLISLVVSTYIPALNNLDLGGWNYLVGAAACIVGLLGLVFLIKLFYSLSVKRRTWRVVDEDEISRVFSKESTGKPSPMLRLKRSVKSGASRFAKTFVDIGRLFKKGGLTAQKQHINSCLSQFEQDDLAMTNARVPLELWMAIGFAALNWLINLILGFF